MRPLLGVLWLGAVGCTSDVGWQGGTGVGNPGSTKLTLARGHDLTITGAEAHVDRLEATRCDGDPGRIAVDGTVDLVAGAGPYAVPGGRWCALTLHLGGPLRLDAARDPADPSSGVLRAELDVERVAVELDAVWIDGPDLILELGHHEWLDPEDVGGLPDGAVVEIGPGDPEHDALAGRVADGSALFVDQDGDGALDGDERAPLGAGAAWETEDDHR